MMAKELQKIKNRKAIKGNQLKISPQKINFSAK
jgi:hypothetical protein